MRIVQAPAWLDRDGDRVSDALEVLYRRSGRAGPQEAGGPPAVDVMICLDHAPTAADVARYDAMGAVQVQTWADLAYVIRARFPAARLAPAALEALGQGPGVVWVEENAVGHVAGYFASRQTRARAVWASGFEGSPSQAVAILDTGIDASHPDFAGRVTGWADFAGADILVEGDEYPAPTDRLGHGTGVAGLAAGDGSTGGIGRGMGALNISMPVPLFTLQASRSFPVDTTGTGGPSALTARLRWQKAAANVFYSLGLLGDPDAGPGLLGNAWTPASAVQPFAIAVANVPPGTFSFFFQAAVGSSSSFSTSPLASPGWLQVSTPMSAAGDGRPLMRGAAPGCKIVGVKIYDDTGAATIGTLLNGLAWLNANRRALNLVCINHSGDFGLASPLLDTVVNQTVRNGVVWVNASGNSRLTAPAILSPASASKVITVGATSEEDRVTSYSSFGRDGQRKPDLVAPGGSIITHRTLIGVDSNSADPLEDGKPGGVPDQFPNDYTIIGAGTSFSAPQVAGAAMLIAQAMGTWSATEAQALRVKMLLSMTASETGLPSERPPASVLNRGDKDSSEGFGRLNTDAAVEAVTQSLAVGGSATGALGPGAWDKKAWARNISLAAGTAYSFTLVNPANSDYDLYVYADDPVTVDGSEGEPQIVASSTGAAFGGSETVEFTTTALGRYYVVVKYVAGAGGAFQVNSAAAADFALSVSPGTQRLEATGENVQYLVSLSGLGGFASSVALSTGTLPEGVTASFDRPTLQPGGTATLTLVTSATTPAGSLTVTISGTAGGVTRTVPARLEVGAIWPRFHHDARSLGRSPLKGPLTARRAWLHAYSREISSSPAIGLDGTIYYGYRGGGLAAARPSDGALLWTFALFRDIDSSPAVGIDGTIYVGASDGRLYALRPNGTLKWQFQFGFTPVVSSPVVGTDGTIYVTVANVLIAVRPDGTRKWSFTGAGATSSSPTLAADGTIYFGAGNRLYALRDADIFGNKKWEFAAVGNILSTPTVAPGGRLYVGSSGDSSGGRFYVLNDGDATAVKIAEFTPAGPVRSSPAVGPNGTVYVGCDDANLYAFNPDGTLKWRFLTSGQVVSSPAVGADGTVYFGSRDKSIYAVRDEGTSATAVWSFATGGEVQASPAIGAGGALYLPSFDGTLYSFADGAQPGFYATITPPVPAQQTALVGTNRTYTVAVQGLNGFAGPVRFELLGALPAGVTATFDPLEVTLDGAGKGQTTLTLASTGPAPAGELRFRVRAVSGSLARETAAASLVLVDYALLTEPGAQRVTAGQSTTLTVAPVPNPMTQGQSSGSFFGSAVGLSAVIVSGPSGGAAPSFAFDANPVTLPGLADMTAVTTTGTPPGAYLVDIRGTVGSVTRSSPFRLEVAGFNVAPAPPTRTVTAGQSATITLSIERLFGFDQPVDLATPGTLPAGMTLSLKNPRITASETATLTVATTAATPPGTYTLTVAGTAGGISRPVTVTVVVTAAGGGS